MFLNGNLILFHLTLNLLKFKQTVQMMIKRRILRRLTWVCPVCQCPSTVERLSDCVAV